MGQPTNSFAFAHDPVENSPAVTEENDEKVNHPDTNNDWDTRTDVDYSEKKTDGSVKTDQENYYENNKDNNDAINRGSDSVGTSSVGSSAFAHGMLMSSGVPTGNKDEGNHEDREDVDPLEINDEGHLVDRDGNKVFTTNEEAIKDGSMVLDAKGRQPGIYLDDLEDLQRRQYGKALETAHNAAAAGKNSPVERQVNVVNSPIPPVTVSVQQQHPDSGDVQDDDAKVPGLKENPLPAE